MPWASHLLELASRYRPLLLAFAIPAGISKVLLTAESTPVPALAGARPVSAAAATTDNALKARRPRRLEFM